MNSWTFLSPARSAIVGPRRILSRLPIGMHEYDTSTTHSAALPVTFSLHVPIMLSNGDFVQAQSGPKILRKSLASIEIHQRIQSDCGIRPPIVELELLQ
jgi:hypothetical protein